MLGGVVPATAQSGSNLIAEAKKGDIKAQLSLGSMYYLGRGAPQDYAKAKYYYELAAAQGLAEAQYNLGVLYNNGQGVRQNYRTAKEWYGKACDNGDQTGCDNYRKLQQMGY